MKLLYFFIFFLFTDSKFIKKIKIFGAITKKASDSITFPQKSKTQDNTNPVISFFHKGIAEIDSNTGKFCLWNEDELKNFSLFSQLFFGITLDVEVIDIDWGKVGFYLSFINKNAQKTNIRFKSNQSDFKDLSSVYSSKIGSVGLFAQIQNDDEDNYVIYAKISIGPSFNKIYIYDQNTESSLKFNDISHMKKYQLNSIFGVLGNIEIGLRYEDLTIFAFIGGNYSFKSPTKIVASSQKAKNAVEEENATFNFNNNIVYGGIGFSIKLR